MKFIVNTATLLRHLKPLTGVIGNKVVIPILEYLHFSVEDGVLTITSTDLEVTMRTSLKVESRENGQVAVPSKIVQEILNELPDQPITFTINEGNNTIEISSDNGKYKLAGENAGDFPPFPFIEGGSHFGIKADVLANAITSTSFSIGTDELRPSMTGLYVQLMNDEVRFVSTDGNKLVLFKRTDAKSENNDSFILPKKTLTLLKNSLPTENNSEVKLEYNKQNAHFSFGELQLVCRLIDERFPDYQSAIPTDTPNKLTVPRTELLSSLRRVAIFANKSTNQVRFKITGNELLLAAQDMDYSSEGQERISCDYVGNDMEIGFNARFLLDMLSTLTADDVILSMSEYNRPGVLRPGKQSDNSEILMLLMPIVINM
ncbi:MAG: DNA polymerase III subunit beta [Bacteroidota bacterium]|nr:DNA polymerase III subunit beta [Bacteroidota bacterium]